MTRPNVTCPSCYGTGIRYVPIGPDGSNLREHPCALCGGRKKVRPGAGHRNRKWRQ